MLQVRYLSQTLSQSVHAWSPGSEERLACGVFQACIFMFEPAMTHLLAGIPA